MYGESEPQGYTPSEALHSADVVHAAETVETPQAEDAPAPGVQPETVNVHDPAYLAEVTAHAAGSHLRSEIPFKPDMSLRPGEEETRIMDPEMAMEMAQAENNTNYWQDIAMAEQLGLPHVVEKLQTKLNERAEQRNNEYEQATDHAIHMISDAIMLGKAEYALPRGKQGISPYMVKRALEWRLHEIPNFRADIEPFTERLILRYSTSGTPPPPEPPR